MELRWALIVGEVAVPVVGVLETHYQIVYWQLCITRSVIKDPNIYDMILP